MEIQKLQRIKNVCSLGVGGRTLIPILLPEIRKIVSSYSSTFHWLDQSYKFTNLYDESPDTPIFLDKFINQYLDNRDQLARRSLNEWLRESTKPFTISTTEQMAFRKFYQSDFYHEILKPMDYHHSLYLGIKEDSAPPGILVLHRGRGERSFSQKDKNNLRELCPLITRALRQKEGCTDTLPSKRDTGICLLDGQGEIKQVSPKARKLMVLAKYPEIRKEQAFSLKKSSLIPERVMSLARQLHQEFSSDDLPSARPKTIQPHDLL